MRPNITLANILIIATLPLIVMTTSCSHSASKYQGMVKIQHIDPSIFINLRYKTSDNITKKPLYPADMPALLRPQTAKRLVHASQLVKQSGYRLLIWDAYRPQSTQIALWNASGKNSDFVSNPHTTPSLHTHGVAVDLTLAFPDGTPAPMPTDFDNFSRKASPHYIHPNPAVRRNLRILKEAMETAGFQYIHSEWWHFLDQDYKKYEVIPALDL